MKPELQHWQEDAHAAFEWLTKVYEQAQALWDDAERYFEEGGWTPKAWGVFGGIAMSQSDMTRWPFFYLKALSATPKDAVYPLTLPIFGISFYDTLRSGPMVYAGACRWASEPSKGQGHWAAYYWLTLEQDRFRRPPHDEAPFVGALPNDGARKEYPGIEAVRWFEIPLGGVATAQQLKAIVGAAIEMAKGNDAPAKDVVASHATS